MANCVQEFRCEHVSAVDEGDGLQVLFETTQGSEEGYVLVQKHFELAGRGECYIETGDRDFCGHFRIQSARLSRYQFQIVFDRKPVKEVVVQFVATDPVYAEVRHVLKIMIPGINISSDGKFR